MTKTIKPKAPAADFRDGVDPEIAEFERGLLDSIGQIKRGEVGRMHTPEMIAGYKTHGRPVGSVKAGAKQAVTVRYSPEVLTSFKASGKGWQARMNDALNLRTAVEPLPTAVSSALARV